MTTLIKKLFLYIVAFIIKPFLKIKKHKVVFWSYYAYKYNCNPRAISDYIVDNNKDFEVVWIFDVKATLPNDISPKIKVVKHPTFASMLHFNTAEFLITNCRTWPRGYMWIKRKKQKYIQTWHGATPLKYVESDCEESLPPKYVTKSKIDSKICDLMLSNSKFSTDLYSKAFWYNGEILEKGVPRNDIFFNNELKDKLRKEIFKEYSIEEDMKVVLYAPTFRSDMTISSYNIDWDTLVESLDKTLNGKVVIMLRLHPNLLIKGVDVTPLLRCNRVVDVTKYHEMQHLLAISDLLVTDYSSSMFDAALIKLPCVLYVNDYESYDRGFYFDLKDLPFPLAMTNKELKDCISQFDKDKYCKDIDAFIDERFGNFENGAACKEVISWMYKNSIQ